jgi:hypothetical protein
MGPGAVYLSIGTLPDGSTMDGGTIVLNNGDFRGILDTIIGALGDAANAVATFLESGETPDEPGTIGLGEVLAAGVSALTGDTQGALNILNGCASGNEDPVLCPTANVNSVPLFTVSMTGGASGGGTPLGSTPASSAPGGGARPSSTPVSSTSGGGATPASGARGATATPVNGATASGAAAGSTSQVSQQPIAQAVKMMQSGQALSGPNGPQPVSVPVSVGNTTVNAMMVPQTPAKLTQNGPPH